MVKKIDPYSKNQNLSRKIFRRNVSARTFSTIRPIEMDNEIQKYKLRGHQMENIRP